MVPSPTTLNSYSEKCELEDHIDPLTLEYYHLVRDSLSSQVWLVPCEPDPIAGFSRVPAVNLEWSPDFVLPSTAKRWGWTEVPIFSSFDTLFSPDLRLNLVELHLGLAIPPDWRLDLLLNLKTLRLNSAASLCTSGSPPSLTSLRADVIPPSFYPLPDSLSHLTCLDYPNPPILGLKSFATLFCFSGIRSQLPQFSASLTALDLCHSTHWKWELVSACRLLRVLDTPMSFQLSSTAVIGFLRSSFADLRTHGTISFDNIDAIARHAEIPKGSILLEPGERLTDRVARLCKKAFPHWTQHRVVESVLCLKNDSWLVLLPSYLPTLLNSTWLLQNAS